MFKEILLAIWLSFLSSSAFAVCTDPLTILNSASTTVNMSVSQNTADSGCMYNITPNQGGAPISATNGWYSNLLQGNAVLSATNGAYFNLLLGNTAVGIGQQLSTASIPVVLPAAQITTLTPPTTVTANPGNTPNTTPWLFTVNQGGNSAKVQAGSSAATGDQALTVADPNVLAALNTATPAGTNRIGYVSDDPCTQKTKINAAFAGSGGTIQLVAPSGTTQVYVCSIVSVGASASVQNLIGGTGAACVTANEEAIIGSTTAASGMSFAANAGFSYGGGHGTVARTTTAGNGVCLLQSGTVAVAGNITYVQQ